MNFKKQLTNSDAMKRAYNELCLSYKDKYKEKEIWRMVTYKDYSSKFVVSNYGRICNMETLTIPPIRIFKKHYNTTISLDNGESINVPIYRLVALAFIPVPQKYLDAGYSIDELVVDHIRDGEEDNFDDNTIWNLQWLTHRENISKAAGCGFRPMYPKDFRDELDKMILDGYDNPSIYKMCKEKYGYEKAEVKAQLQVRRRRLGVTLKEHHENDKAFVKEVDKLVLKGLSNDAIITLLNMSREGRASERLLQYRRSILKKPAKVSKYFNNEDNEVFNELLKKGLSTDELVKHFGMNKKLSPEGLEKFKQTVNARRSLLKKKIASSTTNESTFSEKDTNEVNE